MYKHIKDYELRYTDVDAYDNLKLSSLLSFLEESACLSAAELGFGYNDVSPVHIGFVIANIYVELKRSIKLGEVLTVHTWPLKPKLMIFLREFELFVGDEKVGAGTTRWCMINTETFSMLPASAYFKESDFNNYNTNRSIAFSNWKIPVLTSKDINYSKRITYSDYDHYFHVNNTKYADFLMDVFSVEELREKTISSFQISYGKQCKEGENLSFIREKVDEYDLIEGRVDGELRVQMRIKFNEI